MLDKFRNKQAKKDHDTGFPFCTFVGKHMKQGSKASAFILLKATPLPISEQTLFRAPLELKPILFGNCN